MVLNNVCLTDVLNAYTQRPNEHVGVVDYRAVRDARVTEDSRVKTTPLTDGLACTSVW